VFETWIREKILVVDIQFGFRLGNYRHNLVVRQMWEKHQNKGKKIYCAFADLEKTFDGVPRALRKAAVKEWPVNTVMALYEGAQTAVRT